MGIVCCVSLSTTTRSFFPQDRFVQVAPRHHEIDHGFGTTFVEAVCRVLEPNNWFQLFDQRTESEANYEFHLMGLYKKIDGKGPYKQEVNDEGIATKTITDLVYDTEYDLAESSGYS